MGAGYFMRATTMQDQGRQLELVFEDIPADKKACDKHSPTRDPLS